MKNNLVKLFAIAVVIVPMFVIAAFNMNAAHGVPVVKEVTTADEDIAEVYKSKCALCHKPNAEKFFEPSKMDEVHVEIILKGKKAEKPPHMPAFEPKGMTKDQAKLLVSYMRQMRTPPSGGDK